MLTPLFTDLQTDPVGDYHRRCLHPRGFRRVRAPLGDGKRPSSSSAPSSALSSGVCSRASSARRARHRHACSASPTCTARPRRVSDDPLVFRNRERFPDGELVSGTSSTAWTPRSSTPTPIVQGRYHRPRRGSRVIITTEVSPRTSTRAASPSAQLRRRCVARGTTPMCDVTDR